MFKHGASTALTPASMLSVKMISEEASTTSGRVAGAGTFDSNKTITPGEATDTGDDFNYEIK